jgi:hypothetical protein
VKWPDGRPRPPQPTAFRGIDIVERDVKRAQLALGSQAQFIAADLRRADFGRAGRIITLDVLHYIEYAEQRGILERVHNTLTADGVWLLRIGNAAGGLGFTVAKGVDQMVLLACGQ